jgi:hypothetical protein
LNTYFSVSFGKSLMVMIIIRWTEFHFWNWSLVGIVLIAMTLLLVEVVGVGGHGLCLDLGRSLEEREI